jgi:drug/metabolite transporter (DMT)-like permease
MLAAAVLFSTGGMAIKACALSGWQVACFRSGLGALTLLVLIPGARRSWSPRTLLVGVAYAATLCLYVLSNKLTTASNTIFLQSTAPLYLLLVSPLLLKEPIRGRELLFLAAMALGLSLFFWGREAPQTTAPDPALGNVLAAVSGLTWALTVAGLRWLARTEGRVGGSPAGAAAGAAVAGNLLVCLVCLPLALPVEGAATADWLWVGYLGVVQIGLAYVFMTKSVRRVPALEGALLLLLEPVLNTLWAWLAHGEVPGTWSRLGAATILAATLVHTLGARTNRGARYVAEAASSSES